MSWNMLWADGWMWIPYGWMWAIMLVPLIYACDAARWHSNFANPEAMRWNVSKESMYLKDVRWYLRPYYVVCGFPRWSILVYFGLFTLIGSGGIIAVAAMIVVNLRIVALMLWRRLTRIEWLHEPIRRIDVPKFGNGRNV